MHAGGTFFLSYTHTNNPLTINDPVNHISIPMTFPGGTGGGGDAESVGFSLFTGLTPAVAVKGKY